MPTRRAAETKREFYHEALSEPSPSHARAQACSGGARARQHAPIYCRAAVFTVPDAVHARTQRDLLIEPRWLLPMTPASGVLEGHAVAVDAAAHPRARPGGGAARSASQPREHHVLREHHALLPGLVNAHTRASHALLRGPRALPAARARRAAAR